MLYQMIRNYATAAAKRPSRLKGPPLDLDHVGIPFSHPRSIHDKAHGFSLYKGNEQ